MKKDTNILFLDLYDLQKSGTVVDTRLIVDDGELSIHWNVLDLYGGQQWWTGLGQAGADKSFKKLSALKSHKKTHQTVQCESCDKTFKLSTFYMHRKTCQNVYKCTECDYTAVIFFILVLYKCTD